MKKFILATVAASALMTGMAAAQSNDEIINPANAHSSGIGSFVTTDRGGSLVTFNLVKIIDEIDTERHGRAITVQDLRVHRSADSDGGFDHYFNPHRSSADGGDRASSRDYLYVTSADPGYYYEIYQVQTQTADGEDFSFNQPEDELVDTRTERTRLVPAGSKAKYVTKETYIPAGNVTEVIGHSHRDDLSVTNSIPAPEQILERETVINPGWKAAQLSLENQVKSDLENGRKLTATTKNGVDVVVNIDAGAVSLSKDITKTYSTRSHDLSAYVAPRAGLLGIGKSEYTLGTFAGVEAGASVKAKDGSTKVTVGYDSGNHFRTTGVKDGYRGLRSSAQTDDALFIETESVVKATGSIIGVRVDSEDRVSAYVENDAGARIGAEVNDDGALRLTAGYTVKF